MAGRLGRLVAFFRRADPRGSPPSGWALALDAVVAVGAAAYAVYEMARYRPQPIASVSGPVAAVQHAIQDGLPLSTLHRPMVITPPAHVSLLMLTAAACTALPLACRRLYPILAWLVVFAAIMTLHGIVIPAVALGAAVYGAYSAIAHSRYQNLAVYVVVVTTVAAAARLGSQLPHFPGWFTAVFGILPAAAAGLGIRELRRRLDDSAARLRRAADEAAAATQRALAAERARIASELHDVVTHNVSVMIVQAGAARKILASSPDDAETALLAVESTGREAMGELRNLLGLLSPAADGRESASGGYCGGAAGAAGGGPRRSAGPAGPAAGARSRRAARPGARGSAAARPAAAVGPRPGGRSAALHPQPGLGEIGALIGRVSAAGLPVELRVSGECRPLSPGADLAAYRVIQEGLTNVLRHAGRAPATVGVEWGDDLVITVSDDGGTTGLGSANGESGRGLIGLRERLALYGGKLDAGPRPGGGWQVRAVMPAGTGS